jgi:hypothetical protein
MPFDQGAEFRAAVEEVGAHAGLAGHGGEADGLACLGQLGEGGAGALVRLLGPRAGGPAEMFGSCGGLLRFGAVVRARGADGAEVAVLVDGDLVEGDQDLGQGAGLWTTA